jgi:DNA-binding response OmpR family regulator
LTTVDALIIKGSGEILVIDDEEIVRKMASTILEECGYTVLCAKDGVAGTDLFRKHQNSIKAVLLDMAMPIMSGKETCYELRMIDPEVKILLSSGFRQDDRVVELMRDGSVSFIQKPFTITELSNKIAEVINIK